MMKIVKGKEQAYKDWYEKNSDSYGRACFTYAERWAGMMEEKIKASEEDEIVSLADIAVSMLMEIEEQPTAYDVEKVVKELEDLKMRYYFTIANTGDADKDCAYLNTANAIDRAIEIVKRGGVDEDYWK